jgi:hypothetical protein
MSRNTGLMPKGLREEYPPRASSDPASCHCIASSDASASVMDRANARLAEALATASLDLPCQSLSGAASLPQDVSPPELPPPVDVPENRKGRPDDHTGEPRGPGPATAPPPPKTPPAALPPLVTRAQPHAHTTSHGI